MRVLVVSGIWPPDVGGPASHAPELAAFLLSRRHGVEAVVTADAAPAPREYPVRWVDRAQPAVVRHARVAALVRSRARHADVVYATSMLVRSSLGSALARRPLVVKLVADEAYERARRWGLFEGDLDGFQRWDGDGRVKALRLARNRAFRRVDHLVCPSSYLASLAISWGVPAGRVTVVPNAAPNVPETLPTREEARARLGVDGSVLAFAGRITRQKALETGLAALADVPSATLLIAGDGPDVADVHREVEARGLDARVRFLGPLDRDGVLTLFRAADAALLTSSWENFPHTVVEALSVGTPVVATAVGGVPEVVSDDVNGLLVPAGDVTALAAALRRVLTDDDVRARLAAAAAPSVDELRPERLYTRLEDILEQATRP